MSRATAPAQPPTRIERRVPWVAVLVAAVASAVAGAELAAGGSRAGVILPLAAAVGLGLVWLSLVRFELFLAAILAIRASLDAFKLESGSRSGLDPAGLLSLLLLGVGILWLWAQARRTRVAPSPLTPPLLGLTAAAVASVIFARAPLAAAVDVVRLGTVVVIVLILNRLLVSRRQLGIVLFAIHASAIGPILFGAGQLLTGEGFRRLGGFERIESTFTHPNPFAIYLTLLIVTGAALLPHLEIRMRRWLTAALAAEGLFLIFTFTRSAWIATIVGLTLVGILQSKRLLLVLAAVLVSIAVVYPSALLRFRDLAEPLNPSGTAGNSLVWRVQYWEQALQLSTNPLFGIGLNSIREDTEAEKQPHNDFIRTYVETGVVGLAAYLWFLATLWRVARDGLRRTGSGIERGVAVGYAGAATAFLILSVVSNVITQLVILWYFVAFAAGTIAATRLAARRPVLPR